ncbi:MAG: TetR family transcriptional regulator [Acidobacteria bacterium]|nr:TetR family transcriptional regulator [Acidobacteriota bacterium]
MSPKPSADAPEPRDRHREILETAARLICANGYDATSIKTIADACDLTKPGLYYYVRSKEHLLAEIMNYGMDLFEEQVLSVVMPIADPLERLKLCMEKNVLLVTEERSKEVTIILHEHATLKGEALAQINARKKRYVRFLESSFTEAIRDGRIRPVHPKVATFSFLGMVLWIYKWFRADGEVPEDQLAREMIDLFFSGLEIPAASPRRGATTRRTKATTDEEGSTP